MIKDIKSVERIQRKATKFILKDYTTDYKTRLISLYILPVMYWLDLQDLVFLIKCLQDPLDNINIHRYVSYVNSNTRAGSETLLFY